jgi:thiol-disulfide isomerase/thioredoxin
MVTCEECLKEFKARPDLLQHYKAKHPNASISETREVQGKVRLKKRQRHKGGMSKAKIIALGSTIVILLIISVAVYYTYYGGSSVKPGSNGTSSILATGTQTGQLAPSFPITLLNGSQTTLSQFHGKPLLLWFVTTWCSSCQEGGQMLFQQYYSQLNSKGVVILVIELYNNLGQPGPNLSQFAQNYGGGSNVPGWLYGTSTQSTTYTYDPRAALDVYYLLNRQGVIVNEGFGLPSDLPSIVSENGWYS